MPNPIPDAVEEVPSSDNPGDSPPLAMNSESAKTNPSASQMSKLMDYVRHTNPLTGAGLLDRGLKELERLVPQLIIEVVNYNFYGSKAIGVGAPLAHYGHQRVMHMVEREWWDRLQLQAINSGAIITKELNGDRISLQVPNFLEVYCALYVRAAVNLRNLLAMMEMQDLNEAFSTFLLDANFSGAGRFRTARNLLEQLSQIPIPQFWARRAVSLAGVYKSGVGEPVMLRFVIDNSSITLDDGSGEKTWAMRHGGSDDGRTFRRENKTLSDLTTTAAYYDGNGRASADFADAIINDARWVIDTLNANQIIDPEAAAGTVPSVWIEDLVKVRDLWKIVGVVPQTLPAPLKSPIDSKFEYLQMVNDRPWMWPEERTLLRDNWLLTNLTSFEQDTIIRELPDSPPDIWWAGFGCWAFSHAEADNHVNGKMASNNPWRLYGEIDPYVSVSASRKTGPNDDQGNPTTYVDSVGHPFYIWYNRRDRWHRGVASINDNVLKAAGRGSELPTLDPLVNRNVNLVKAARILHEVDPVGKYPVNRPYMMEVAEQNLDDLADGWLITMSRALEAAEN